MDAVIVLGLSIAGAVMFTSALWRLLYPRKGRM